MEVGLESVIRNDDPTRVARIRRADRGPQAGPLGRQRFLTELSRAVRQARETGRSLALATINLDDFQTVNHSLGHQVGDKIIGAIGKTIQNAAGREALVGRMGADEFAVLVEGARALEVQKLTRGLVAAVRRSGEPVSGHRVPLSASCGVSLCPPSATAEDLLVEAELALAQAKAHGGNCVRVYDHARNGIDAARSRLAWRNRLAEALATGGFLVMGQPIVRLDSGEVTQYEFLIRMAGQGTHLFMPSDFLPFAQYNRAINDIDLWVTGEAIRSLAHLEKSGSNVAIAVNLASQTLLDGEFLQFVRRAIRSRGIDGRKLVFELTETAALVDIRSAEVFMKALGEIGCRFSLDDFGCGFSSLSHLRTLPFDFLKIDGSFVLDVRSDAVSQALIRGLTEAAAALGKETIAEWVPDAECARVLSELGVKFGQGSYFGDPQLVGVPLFANGAAVSKAA